MTAVDHNTSGGVSLNPGGIALMLLGFYPAHVLAEHLLLPSTTAQRQSEKRQALAVFVGQTAINTAVLGWAGKRFFGMSGLSAYATGLGASLAMSGSLFAYAYHRQKDAMNESKSLSAPKAATIGAFSSRTGELVSPEF